MDRTAILHGFTQTGVSKPDAPTGCALSFSSRQRSQNTVGLSVPKVTKVPNFRFEER